MRSLVDKWRIVFMFGLVLLTFSLFLDWYIYECFDPDYELIISCHFNPFFGWTTNLKEGDPLIKLFSLENFTIQLLPINFLFIGLICIAFYSGAFVNIEDKVEIENIRNIVVSNLFLLVVNMYYIFIFPVMYLIPNSYAFPLLTYEGEVGIFHEYSVGPGYVLQAIGFVCIFPYIIFCYVTFKNFQSEKNSPKKTIKKYVEEVQEPLDLDKYIAEENLILEFGKGKGKEDISSAIKKRKVKVREYE